MDRKCERLGMTKSDVDASVATLRVEPLVVRSIEGTRITRYVWACLGGATKRALFAAGIAALVAGCCCTKPLQPAPATTTGPLCPNQSVDPACTTLVMAAFCQAKARPDYGNCELYPVSRGFEIVPADKGKRLREMTVSLNAPAAQTCQQACEQLGEAFDGSSTGWQSVVYDDGRALGVADIGALFFGDAAGHLMTVGGRPDSVYLQQDTSYADWCCCARHCGISAPAKSSVLSPMGRSQKK
jgi:hypothetical protein